MKKIIKNKDANGKSIFQVWEYFEKTDDEIILTGTCISTGHETQEEAEKFLENKNEG